MSLALAHRTRIASTVAAISLLLSGGALAQTANGGGVQNAKVQAAYAIWRQLSQTEVNCVDQSLRGQRSSLWSLIQRGIDPSNATVARLRAGCRAQARAPNSAVMAQNGSQALAAAGENIADKSANKAAAERAAADKASADKAAAEKAAAVEKAAANKLAADKAAADKAAAEKLAADKAAAEKAAAYQVAIALAKAEAERATPDTIKPQPEAESPRQEAEKSAADVAWATAAAESRMSFIYGLISSPICFGLGGVVFLWVQRRRRANGSPSEASPPDHASRDSQREFDRLVTAVLAESKRRGAGKSEPGASVNDRRIDESVLH